MGKKTKIPELVVNKIYIDGGGDSSQVYTFEVDDTDGHKLRIGNNQNKKVATINQLTGEIEAASLKGDGKGITGLTAEALAEIESAKLLTLDTTGFLFRYDGDGYLDPANQSIKIKANIQNIPNAIIKWDSPDNFEVSHDGQGLEDQVTITGVDFGDRDSLTITATVEDENLYDEVTLVKIKQGEKGRDAITVLLTNESHTFKADSLGQIASTAGGETDIIVFAGPIRLMPRPSHEKDTQEDGTVLSFPVALDNGQFNVQIAEAEDVEFLILPDENYITPSTGDVSDPKRRMRVAAPVNMAAGASVGSVKFTITAKDLDGNEYEFEKLQSFSKSSDGAVGSDAKTVKLVSDDYQIAYNSDGADPSPNVINLSASTQNHPDGVSYRFSVNDKAWMPGDGADYILDGLGNEIDSGASGHIFQGIGTAQIKPTWLRDEFGFRKSVKVETSDGSDIIASDNITVIATRDGSNAIMIAADNLTHAFPAGHTGIVDNSDWDDAEIKFEVYKGNDLVSPAWDDTTNSFHMGTLDDGVFTPSTSMPTGSFVVIANASQRSSDPDAETIVPGNPVKSGDGIKYLPRDMHADESRAAIVYSFYVLDKDGTLVGPINQTQTFTKAAAGESITGEDGANAKAVKLTADDYQVAYDADGVSPETLNTDDDGNPKITIKATGQNATTNRDIYRFSVDGVEVTPTTTIEGIGGNWHQPNEGEDFVFFEQLLINDKYADFKKKKVISVEMAEYTEEPSEFDPEYIFKTVGPVLAEDSISVIATKDGSDVVEVIADNLTHVFPEDVLGNIDYSDGGIGFEAYLGNQQLLPWRGWQSTDTSANEAPKTFEADAPNHTFHVSVDPNSRTGNASATIKAGAVKDLAYETENNVEFPRFEFGPPENMVGTKASMVFTIKAKDGAGNVRNVGDRIQTFVKTVQPSDAKSLRLNASSYAFSFEEKASVSATPTAISVFLESQNTDTVPTFADNIIIKDSYGVEVTSWPDDTPPEIQSSDGNYYFDLELFDLLRHSMAQPQDRRTSDIVYNEAWTEPPESAPELVHDLKNFTFPISVHYKDTNVSGDKISLYSINGGTDAVTVVVPNDNHTFPANSDGEVSELDWTDAESDIMVFHGATILGYNSDEETAGTWHYRDNFTYKTRGGVKTGDARMVELYEEGDANFNGDKIGVKIVRSAALSNTVTLPIRIIKPSGEKLDVDKILTYSVTKEGRDGTNIKDRNYNFEQGATGWSTDGSATKGADLLSSQLSAISDPDEQATYGSRVGKFKSEGFILESEDDGGTYTVYDQWGAGQNAWISEAIPVGEFGAFEIIFRIKGLGPDVTNNWNTNLRCYAFIQTYDSAGVGSFEGESLLHPTDSLLWFPELLKENTSNPNHLIRDGGSLAKDAMKRTGGTYEIFGEQRPFVEEYNATRSEDVLFSGVEKNGHGCSLPVRKSNYTTFKAEVSAEQLKELQEGATTFKIGFWCYCLDGRDIALNDLLVDTYQVLFISEATTTSRTDAERAGVEATTNKHQRGASNEEQSEQVPGALYNGKLNIKNMEDGFPDGILTTRKNSSTMPLRNETSGIIPFDGGGVTILPAKYGGDGISGGDDRKGIIFKAVKVESPGNTKISVRVHYSRTLHEIDDVPVTGEGLDGEPAVWVYFSDEEIEPHHKYIASSNTDFKTSAPPNGGGMTSYGPNDNSVAYRVGATSESAFNTIDGGDNIYAYKNLIAYDIDGDGISTRHEKLVIDSGDAGENLPTGGTGSPKWFSVVIYGAQGDNESQITITEVSVEQEIVGTLMLGNNLFNGAKWGAVDTNSKLGKDSYDGLMGANISTDADGTGWQIGFGDVTNDDGTTSNPYGSLGLPRTKNEAIKIGPDGVISGIGTPNVSVDNANAFDDGTTGAGVKSDAEDGKKAYTGIDGMSIEDSGDDGIKITFGGNNWGDLVASGVKNSAVDKEHIGMGSYPDNPEGIVDDVFDDDRFTAVGGQNFDFSSRTGWSTASTIGKQSVASSDDFSLLENNTGAKYGRNLGQFVSLQWFFSATPINVDNTETGKYRFTLRQKNIDIAGLVYAGIECYSATQSLGKIYFNRDGSVDTNTSDSPYSRNTWEEGTWEITSQQLQSLRSGTTNFKLFFKLPHSPSQGAEHIIVDTFKVEYNPHADLEEMDPTSYEWASKGKGAYDGLNEGIFEDDGTGKLKLKFPTDSDFGHITSPFVADNERVFEHATWLALAGHQVFAINLDTLKKVKIVPAGDMAFKCDESSNIINPDEMIFMWAETQNLSDPSEKIAWTARDQLGRTVELTEVDEFEVEVQTFECLRYLDNNDFSWESAGQWTNGGPDGRDADMKDNTPETGVGYRKGEGQWNYNIYQQMNPNRSPNEVLHGPEWIGHWDHNDSGTSQGVNKVWASMYREVGEHASLSISKFSFYYYMYSYNSAYETKMRVYVKPNGGSWTQMSINPDVDATTPPASTTQLNNASHGFTGNDVSGEEWRRATVDLSSFAGTSGGYQIMISSFAEKEHGANVLLDKLCFIETHPGIVITYKSILPNNPPSTEIKVTATVGGVSDSASITKVIDSRYSIGKNNYDMTDSTGWHWSHYNHGIDIPFGYTVDYDKSILSGGVLAGNNLPAVFGKSWGKFLLQADEGNRITWCCERILLSDNWSGILFRGLWLNNDAHGLNFALQWYDANGYPIRDETNEAPRDLLRLSDMSTEGGFDIATDSTRDNFLNPRVGTWNKWSTESKNRVNPKANEPFTIRSDIPTAPAGAVAFKIGWYIWKSDQAWRQSADYTLYVDYYGPYRELPLAFEHAKRG